MKFKMEKKSGEGMVCEPRIEVILKIQKIVGVRSGGERALGGLMWTNQEFKGICSQNFL